MGRYLKKNDISLGSPQETMGFSKDFNFSNAPIFQNFQIQKFDFTSLEQVADIKQHLMRRKILILNAKELFDSNQVSMDTLKNTFDELKMFLHQNGGSIGRLGEYYLVLTPNSNVKMGF